MHHHLDDLERELRKHPELWEPYQTIEEVIAKVDDGRYQLWYGGVRQNETCIWGITETRRFTSFSTATVIWCSGQFGPSFYALWINELERFCGIMGLNRIVIEAGRQGWFRVFEPLGFRVAAIELVKDVGDGPKTTL